MRQAQSAGKPGERTLDDSSLSAASNRSPFQRVKKHVKQIITGECECVNEETVVFDVDYLMIAVECTQTPNTCRFEGHFPCKCMLALILGIVTGQNCLYKQCTVGCK